MSSVRVPDPARLGQAARTYQRQIDVLDSALAEYLQVNRTDLRCVDVLLEEPLSAKDLAAAAGLSPSAATTALDRLERIGYVRRTREDHDRRRLAAELTPRALELLADALGDYASEAEAEANGYTADEVDLIIGFLRAGTDRRARHALRLRELARARAATGAESR